MPRRLSLRKWIPAFLYAKVQDEDLGDITLEGTVADGSVTPDKLDRPYIEATFGAEAEGQPPGIIRQIKRAWVQDGKLYGESEDEF